MGKSSHFSGQPYYCQVIKMIDKSKVLHSPLLGAVSSIQMLSPMFIG